MIIGFILLILLVFKFPSGPARRPARSSPWNEFCGAIVRSTCTDDFTTNWNSKNIGKNLKMWMNNIESMETITESEMKYYHVSKTFFTGRATTIVKYIGNKNCLTSKTFGPVWKIASDGFQSIKFQSNSFHDGFLYGIEAENGTFTGIYCAYLLLIFTFFWCIYLYNKTVIDLEI
jgi:hypothetical protein